jgi:hypothetical protein
MDVRQTVTLYLQSTDLDKRVPETAGMAPDSEQEILLKSLKKSETRQVVLDSLKAMRRESMA